MSEATTTQNSETSELQLAIDRALRRIDAELSRRPKRLLTISAGARVALEISHPEYLADLGQLAVRLARSDRVSTVDAIHVERAAQLLVTGTGPQVLATVLNSLGSLFAGVGGAIVVDFATDPTKQPVPVTIVGIVLSVLGFTVLSAGIFLSFTRSRFN